MEVSIFSNYKSTTYHSKLFIFLFIYNSYMEVSIVIGRMSYH